MEWVQTLGKVGKKVSGSFQGHKALTLLAAFTRGPKTQSIVSVASPLGYAQMQTQLPDSALTSSSQGCFLTNSGHLYR